MRILVTGGTGYVGGHAVARLVGDGHEVRLFARAPQKVAEMLAMHGLEQDRVEAVFGDVLDEGSVDRALSGVDAVLHAASVYSFDPRRSAVMEHVNIEGARHVLRSAAQLGLDPIVHVSTTGALHRVDVDVNRLGPDNPPGNDPEPYARSKTIQEQEARQLQDRGAPVVIVYPGAVFGPRDPNEGESTQVIRNAIRGRQVFVTRGQIPLVDVRDVAAVLDAVFDRGRGPRRYVAVGHIVPPTEILEAISTIAGVRRPVVALPDRLALMVGRLADRLQQHVRPRLPISYEMALHAILKYEIDSSRTREELGIAFRPWQETLRDHIKWLTGAAAPKSPRCE